MVLLVCLLIFANRKSNSKKYEQHKMVNSIYIQIKNLNPIRKKENWKTNSPSLTSNPPKSIYYTSFEKDKEQKKIRGRKERQLISGGEEIISDFHFFQGGQWGSIDPRKPPIHLWDRLIPAKPVGMRNRGHKNDGCNVVCFCSLSSEVQKESGTPTAVGASWGKREFTCWWKEEE